MQSTTKRRLFGKGIQSLYFSDLGEFAFIERLKQIAFRHSAQTRLGIGDDAAVWQPSLGHSLCLSCDAQVEGRHFLPLAGASAQRWQAVGRRCAQVNLSDLAAMAAVPKFALVSLGLPARTPIAGMEALYRGLVSALDEAEAVLLGGNITAVEGPFWLDITVGGEVAIGQAISRDGAKEGDWIGVTGFPGSAAAGLQILLAAEEMSGLDKQSSALLTRAYEAPQARWKEARAIAPCLRALTDISDGLWMDIRNVIPSGLGLVLTEDRLPVSPALRVWSDVQQRSLMSVLSEASDDYELVVVASEEHKVSIEKALQSYDCPLHWLGALQTQGGRLLWEGAEGQRPPVRGGGWEHRS